MDARKNYFKLRSRTQTSSSTRDSTFKVHSEFSNSELVKENRISAAEFMEVLEQFDTSGEIQLGLFSFCFTLYFDEDIK